MKQTATLSQNEETVVFRFPATDGGPAGGNGYHGRSQGHHAGRAALGQGFRDAPRQACLVPDGEFMFPDTKDSPTRGAQGARHEPVALPVALDFGIPVPPVRGRTPVTSRASVPEAPVHKQHCPLPRKHEVRLADEFLPSPPPGHAVSAEQRGQFELGAAIAMRTHRRHHPGTRALGNDVTHRSTQARVLSRSCRGRTRGYGEVRPRLSTSRCRTDDS